MTQVSRNWVALHGGCSGGNNGGSNGDRMVGGYHGAG